MVNKWLQFIQHGLAPARCRLCRAPGWRDLELCRACLDDLPRAPEGCPGCGRPLSPAGGLCPRCRRRPPAWDGLTALFSYEFPVDRLIQAVKFGHDLALAQSLGRLLSLRLARRDRPLPHRLLPVPLHPARLRSRGFNQARELARPLRALGLELDGARCLRIRDTPAQSGLDAAGRRHNLRAAFAVRGRLDGEHLAVVDDVMTTGATLDALVRALKAAGAARVEAWVIARTPPP